MGFKIVQWNVDITWVFNNCPTRCNTKQSIYYSASSLYMFRVLNTPIIRSAQNCNYSLRYRSYVCAATPSNVAKLACPFWREVAAQKLWPVPEAVVTVLCTTDDGCCWHPKHVEWTCRIINRLLCVAPRWTIINIIIRHLSLGNELCIPITDIRRLTTGIRSEICVVRRFRRCAYVYLH